MRKNFWFIMLCGVAMLALSFTSCKKKSTTVTPPPTNVKRATVKVETQADGLTTEQQNVKNRLLIDNKVGSIKHLYVISAYSGQTLIYSTVKGKVTSSGKRLTPVTVSSLDGDYVDRDFNGMPVSVNGSKKRTTEVLQDDGTYGSSIPYLYWWDTRGIYHQHYVSGGQIIHVSDQPVSVKSVIINMEVSPAPPTDE